jgi:hypothetical protein
MLQLVDQFELSREFQAGAQRIAMEWATEGAG